MDGKSKTGRVVKPCCRKRRDWQKVGRRSEEPSEDQKSAV